MDNKSKWLYGVLAVVTLLVVVSFSNQTNKLATAKQEKSRVKTTWDNLKTKKVSATKKSSTIVKNLDANNPKVINIAKQFVDADGDKGRLASIISDKTLLDNVSMAMEHTYEKKSTTFPDKKKVTYLIKSSVGKRYVDVLISQPYQKNKQYNSTVLLTVDTSTWKVSNAHLYLQERNDFIS